MCVGGLHHLAQVALGLAALLLVQVLLARAADHHLAGGGHLVALGGGLQGEERVRGPVQEAVQGGLMGGSGRAQWRLAGWLLSRPSQHHC